MSYWIILILLIVVGIYDLYLYAIAKVRTITQRIHALAKRCPRWIRIAVSFFLLGFSWYNFGYGGIQVFVPVLCGWLLCHLIGWDF